MKSYIKLLTLGAVLAGTSACTDLDVDLDNQYTEYPDNPIAIEAKFTGCYTSFQSILNRDYKEMVLLSSDEFFPVSFDGDYRDVRYAHPYLHEPNPDDWYTQSCYNSLSGGIVTCNNVILEMGGEDGKDPVVAPIRAIRAFYHFMLMDNYGDVPVLERNVAEGELIERSPRADVAKFVEKELLEVIPQLTEDNTTNTYGKPNKWMAEALLVKLYLNWGVYTNPITSVDNNTDNEKLADCVKWCDEIINSGLFEVGVGYRKKFFPDNGVHIKDFIYALDVDPATKPDGTTTWYRWFGFKKDGLCRPYTLGWENTKSLAGQTVLTPEAVARFNLPNDERNIMILAGPQFAFDASYNRTNEPVYIYTVPGNEKTLVGQLNYRVDFDFDDASIYSLGDEALPKPSKETVANGTALLNIQKGARCFKYPPREEDYSLWNRQQANDTPIFRFADILLMKAECILRGATATFGHTPMGLFNEIRRCSKAPELTKNPTMQELLDERSREFILEPWRRNDLIRFGQFENDWGQKNKYKVWDDAEHTTFHWVERPGVKDPNRRLMPIHRGILETNLNWSQNPGYQGL